MGLDIGPKLITVFRLSYRVNISINYVHHLNLKGSVRLVTLGESSPS